MAIPFFSTLEVSEMENAIASVSVGRCDIKRITTPDEVYGGVDEVSTTIATGVAVRFYPIRLVRGAVEEIQGDRISVWPRYMFILPAGQDLLPVDQLVVTTLTPNRTFEINEVLEPRTSEAFRRAITHEVT